MPVYNESRKNIIRLIFIALFVIIIARLLTLQIFTSKYKALAEDQAARRPGNLPMNTGGLRDE